MKSLYSVCHFPCQPHCFSYGGFDFQMNRVIDLLKASGENIQKIDLWDKNSRFKIAHFWGAEESHKLCIKFCLERDIKVIISVLFPPMTKKEQVKQSVKVKLRKFLGILPAYYSADVLIVINDQQADFAAKILGISKQKICIIPTILDDSFFSKKSNETSIAKGRAGLCVGTICLRKNQVALMAAAIKTECPITFVGKLEDAEADYIAEFRSNLEKRPDLFTHLTDVGSDGLRSLYLECGFVACISFSETEPASILEGMIFKKPILASNRPFSHNSKFLGIHLCEPTSIDSIARSLRSIIKIQTTNYPNFDAESHSSEKVIPKFIKLYRSLLN